MTSEQYGILVFAIQIIAAIVAVSEMVSRGIEPSIYVRLLFCIGPIISSIAILKGAVK